MPRTSQLDTLPGRIRPGFSLLRGRRAPRNGVFRCGGAWQGAGGPKAPVRTWRLASVPNWWDIPSVQAIETRIDERCRPGALTGLVEPGQRYRVERLTPTEFRFRLMVVAEPMAPAKIIRRGNRTVGECAPVSRQAIQAALAEFP